MPTLRFVTANDLVSQAIRGGEMGFWASHVEALMYDGTLLGAHFDGGVLARPRGYDRGKWSRELFVTLPPVGDDLEAVGEAWLRAQIGKPYDIDAIGEMAIGILRGEAPKWKEAEAFICSALMTGYLLMTKSFKSAPATVRLATPRDVLVGCAALTPIGDPQPPGESS
jgi:hypothetical protein